MPLDDRLRMIRQHCRECDSLVVQKLVTTINNENEATIFEYQCLPYHHRNQYVFEAVMTDEELAALYEHGNGD